MSMELKKVIVQTAIYYGRILDEQVLEMMYSDLADLDPNKCINSYAQWRRNPKNKAFPLPAQIRELVTPDAYVSNEALAREIASRIVGGITKFGWCNGRAAEEYIGPVGWDAVRRAGGWNYLCQNTGVSISPTTLQAQMRDQIAGTLEYGSFTIDKAIAAGEREKPKELEAAGAVLKRLALIPGEPEEGA